jgi:2-desacetyl-2-hydroxyethyl bacteriochlorophyllide A dehydrogenase
MTVIPTMPLVQVHGIDDVRIDTVECPVVGPNDALVRVSACGICGSDLGYIAMGGLTAPGTPMPLGHEFSGTIESLGGNVSHLQTGQRVTVNPMANNHSIGNGGSEGAFAPLLLVKDAATTAEAVLPIPDEISFEQGALIEPLAVAMHGVNQSGARAGQSALVLGAGPIGLCSVVVLKYFGVENVVVADQSPHRLDIARQLGASAVCNVAEQELNEVLVGAHGQAELMGMPLPATDVYIEATGVGAVLEQAIALARPGASVVVVGVHKAPIQLDPLTLLMKELHLTGSMAYPTEFPVVIEMLMSGEVDLDPLVSHRFELADFMQALAIAKDPQQATKVMITL